MVSLKPLEAVGYNRAFFRLPEEGNLEKEFMYYTFDNVYPPGFANDWNIVGLRYRRINMPLFDIQMMYVGDDELSMDEFHPAQTASRFLWLHSPELQALIEFFEDAIGYQVTDENRTFRHFHLLNPDELARLHFKQWAIDMYACHCYRYMPDQELQNTASTILIEFPQWIQNHKLTQSTTLEMIVFDQQQLADPEFFPPDTYGLATVTFNQRALEEFILLLKQRTYEAALQAFQS
jgi:hypothetical protein